MAEGYNTCGPSDPGPPLRRGIIRPPQQRSSGHVIFSRDQPRQPQLFPVLDRPFRLDVRSVRRGGGGKSKAEGVADAINRLLQNLVIKCAKSRGRARLLRGRRARLWRRRWGRPSAAPWPAGDLVPISEVGNRPARVEERTKKVDDGAGGLVDQTVKFPVWFDPVANGATPMCAALDRAQQILSGWIGQHAASYPPIVINITDGEATDGDPIRTPRH